MLACVCVLKYNIYLSVMDLMTLVPDSWKRIGLHKAVK
jgi:hypothetical protein